VVDGAACSTGRRRPSWHGTNAPAHIVFEAWSKPELFKRWWVPKSAGLSLLSCDMDVRTGGAYRLVFRHPTSDQAMAFFEHVQRSDTAQAPRLDERRKRSGRRDHGDV
jgi:uncharacterized protein YndB with AHSA1/START domain